MPDIDVGRKKVVAFLEKNDLASVYGRDRQEVTNILNGSTRGPKANKFILQVIADYNID